MTEEQIKISQVLSKIGYCIIPHDAGKDEGFTYSSGFPGCEFVRIRKDPEFALRERLEDLITKHYRGENEWNMLEMLREAYQIGRESR